MNEQKRRGWWRWIVLGLFLVVGAGTIVWVQRNDDLEENIRGILSHGIGAVTFLLSFLWTLIFVVPTWKWRVALGITPLLLGAIAYNLLKPTGSDGNGALQFVWRWEKATGESIEKIQIVAPKGVVPAPEGAADFLRFLGNTGLNRVDGVSLGRDWKITPPREVWRREVGPAWTGFVVSGGLALTQEQRGPEELVVAYELATGNPVWSHARSVRFVEFQGGDGPRATPTIIGDKVFVMGATGWLACHELLTGALLWETDVLSDPKAKNPIWAKSCSPLFIPAKIVPGQGEVDRIIVTGGDAPGPTLLAYDAKTGKKLWQAGTDGASYATPVLAKLIGRDLILSVNATSVTVNDIASGKILGSHPWPGMFPKCSDPMVVSGDKILITAGYQMGDHLLQAKAQDDNIQLDLVWSGKGIRTGFSNCVIRDNAAYGIDDNILAAIDLKDGKRLWKSERVGSGQVLAVGDLLLVQTEPGPILLVEVSPAGSKVLGKLKGLDGKTWTNLCLAGKWLLARNDREAVCYELPVK